MLFAAAGRGRKTTPFVADPFATGPPGRCGPKVVRRKVMRIRQGDSEKEQSAPEPFPFNGNHPAKEEDRSAFPLSSLTSSAAEVYQSLENMSRRIDDLARELKCLGFFDDEDDSPRAA
jgi:hypothetical protein